QPWLAKPTWNGVLSSSWWNRSMCGPLLMLASHYTDTRFVTMARTGGLSWYRLGIWPGTRYGGRDRGESGESAARTKYHSHGIPCPVMSSLVSASCTLSTGLYRVLDRLSRGSTRYKRRGAARIGSNHMRQRTIVLYNGTRLD